MREIFAQQGKGVQMIAELFVALTTSNLNVKYRQIYKEPQGSD
ncbi:MAG: hypothetical protein OFPI_21910 [Osedax symbiont Rs2]|nr:MAG: hypothetical protein OFPI_21910 [Osedax symbiont Rs2]